MTPLELANLCFDAYTIESEDIAPFHSGGVHGFVSRRPNEIVLAFRGSDALEDWLTNVDARTYWFSEYQGHVHSGFGNTALAIRPEVYAALQQIDTQDRPLWVTGHSYGGALALLWGQLLRARNPLVATFGAPRVLCRDAAGAYEPCGWRFVNGYDLVPRLPSPLRGFRHALSLVGIGRGGWLRYLFTSPSDSLRDHLISRYVETLTTDPQGAVPLCLPG